MCRRGEALSRAITSGEDSAESLLWNTEAAAPLPELRVSTSDGALLLVLLKSRGGSMFGGAETAAPAIPA
jgi:hypothetical protein